MDGLEVDNEIKEVDIEDEIKAVKIEDKIEAEMETEIDERVMLSNEYTTVNNFVELQSAIYNPLSGGEQVIYVTEDIEMTETITISRPITIKSDINHPATLKWKGEADARHFYVERGQLTLEAITLDGHDVGGGISLGILCTVTMEKGSVLQNNRSTTIGGGVYTHGSNIEFIMKEGATIQNNTAEIGGGGVFLEGISNIFVMEEGAVIRENTAGNSGGGVRVQQRGEFVMNGGYGVYQ